MISCEFRLKQPTLCSHKPCRPTPSRRICDEAVYKQRPTKETLTSHELCMNHLLHLRINPHHFLIEVRMISHQDIRIPRRSNENSIDTTTNRRHEDLADLQSNQEGESHNDRGKCASLIISWFRELQVEVGEKGADVGHEC